MSKHRAERLRMTAVTLIAAATLAHAAAACSDEPPPAPTPQATTIPTLIPHNPDSVSQLTTRLSNSRDDGQPGQTPEPIPDDQQAPQPTQKAEPTTVPGPAVKIFVIAVTVLLLTPTVVVIWLDFLRRRRHNDAQRSDT